MAIGPGVFLVRISDHVRTMLVIRLRTTTVNIPARNQERSLPSLVG